MTSATRQPRTGHDPGDTSSDQLVLRKRGQSLPARPHSSHVRRACARRGWCWLCDRLPRPDVGSLLSHPSYWRTQSGSLFDLPGHYRRVRLLCDIAQRRFQASALAAATFHLHLLCDIISGRGPDDYQWPIPYLMPFSDSVNWTWSGQWYLHGWQNTVVYVVFVAVTVFIAMKKRVTPIDLLSKRWDGAVLRSFVSMSSKRK